MQTIRVTRSRSSVLGKRSHQDGTSGSSTLKADEQLHSPESTPNPKRIRTSTEVTDGDANKENIPPFFPSITIPETPTSARAVRALRRNVSEIIATAPSSSQTRPGMRRHMSMSVTPATPTTEIAQLSLLVTPPPTPPNTLLPIHTRARALLRSTCNSAVDMAGREVERATIIDFVNMFTEGSNSDQDPTCLYISGSPGTGKTALVNSIFRTMSTTPDEIQVISVNCMALNGIDALWDRLIEELSVSIKKKSPGRTKKTFGRDAVQVLLTTLRKKCILMLDELDHITPNPQTLLSIFSLPDSVASLRIIAIANTHTLTASSVSATVSSLDNIQTLHFAPYTPIQLLQILQSRLAPLYETEDLEDGPAKDAAKKFLPTPTLTLLTKKVASLTGDVRCLFEILRGAIDIAATAVSTALPTADENPLNAPPLSVTPSHILTALKAYSPSSKKGAGSINSLSTASGSETITKVRNLGLQHRLVLLSILLASKRIEAGFPINNQTISITASPKKTPASPTKRTSSALAVQSITSIETSQLHSYYTMVLNRSDAGVFDAISKAEFGDVLGLLETIGLIALSSSLQSCGTPTGASKGRKAFGRAASFSLGLNKNGAGSVGDVRIAESVLGDEILRGLGVESVAAGENFDVMEEELRAIWAREKSRLTKELKASVMQVKDDDVLVGAFQQ
ncbi:P-loop containing nucleoside triphosphate hydrolase protein [Cyathus striatus]|nr:P-loop containing nucleoside triphosphate hydrolase protein [Cyathus striatus]